MQARMPSMKAIPKCLRLTSKQMLDRLTLRAQIKAFEIMDKLVFKPVHYTGMFATTNAEVALLYLEVGWYVPIVFTVFKSEDDAKLVQTSLLPYEADYVNIPGTKAKLGTKTPLDYQLLLVKAFDISPNFLFCMNIGYDELCLNCLIGKEDSDDEYARARIPLVIHGDGSVEITVRSKKIISIFHASVQHTAEGKILAAWKAKNPYMQREFFNVCTPIYHEDRLDVGCSHGWAIAHRYFREFLVYVNKASSNVGQALVSFFNKEVGFLMEQINYTWKLTQSSDWSSQMEVPEEPEMPVFPDDREQVIDRIRTSKRSFDELANIVRVTLGYDDDDEITLEDLVDYLPQCKNVDW